MCVCGREYMGTVMHPVISSMPLPLCRVKSIETPPLETAAKRNIRATGIKFRCVHRCVWPPSVARMDELFVES